MDLVRVAGVWLPFDEILFAVECMLNVNHSRNEQNYHDISQSHTVMLACDSPRFSAVIHTILVAFEVHDELISIGTLFLEPIVMLIRCN
jgi:hypothetical protein